jgi:hypothetical protein
MHNATTWQLPFGSPAELQLLSEWGSLTLLPVEAGGQPRLELTRGSAEHVDVNVERHADVVRVSLDPRRSLSWFGGWECRATLYVPPDVHAAVQTSAGSVTARDLHACQLGIKASAGKIHLERVYGVLHLAAEAGSIHGDDVGGMLEVQTQAGSVRLSIGSLQPGEHRIRGSVGSVRLEIARDLKVCIETHSSFGSLRTSYPSDPTSAVRLLVSTEMGSVRIDEAPFGARPSPPVSSAPTSQHTATPPRQADAELERVLAMVESGELSARDADELLRAMGRV